MTMIRANNNEGNLWCTSRVDKEGSLWRLLPDLVLRPLPAAVPLIYTPALDRDVHVALEVMHFGKDILSLLHK